MCKAGKVSIRTAITLGAQMHVPLVITHRLFEAYLQCPMKCWLRAHDQLASGNVYAEWVRSRTESYRVTEAQRLARLYGSGDFDQPLSSDLDDEFHPTAENPKKLPNGKWHLMSG